MLPHIPAKLPFSCGLAPAFLRARAFIGAGLQFFAIVIFLLAIAPFLYALFFCFPAGDDFDEATRAMSLFDLPGGIYEIGREWLTWSGRYAYHFLAVFLGKAVESRTLCGVVCAMPLSTYGLACVLLCRSAHGNWRHCLYFGALGLMGLCACSQDLPVFYLLTDALTAGLQGGSFLIFAGCLCLLRSRLAQNEAIKMPFLFCVGSGIFAIGIYEHSALAVIFFTLAIYLDIYLHQRKLAISKKLDLHVRKALLRLFIWLFAALIFSFLAPGNFQRQAVRSVDATLQLAQLANLWNEWLAAQALFMGSLWSAFVFCLLLFLYLSGQIQKQSSHRAWTRIVLALVCFFCFSLGITALHALSDAPLSSAPKLGASLGFYAAVALGFIFFQLFSIFPPIQNVSLKKLARLAAICACFFMVFTSQNFLETATNAANGLILTYGEFMNKRDAVLLATGKTDGIGNTPFRFGLAGEIIRKGKRRSGPEPDWPLAKVPALPFAVFPLAKGEPLHASAKDWPNTWAAWYYGIGGIEAEKPQDTATLHAVEQGMGVELHVPPDLRQQGIRAAWRLNCAFRQNPLFDIDWLVLKTDRNLPPAIKILLPFPPNLRRLAPICIQEYLLTELVSKPLCAYNLKEKLAAPLLKFDTGQWHHEGHYLFPLGLAQPYDNEKWPLILFISGGDGPFIRLMPFVK